MAGLAAGVDLGGTKIQTVVLRNRKVVGSSRLATPQTGAPDVLAAIARVPGLARVPDVVEPFALMPDLPSAGIDQAERQFVGAADVAEVVGVH